MPRRTRKVWASCRAEHTAAGRGLILTQDVAPRTKLLSIPIVNVLCVSEEPAEANQVGQAALAAWEAAHGRLPGLLHELLSGTSRLFVRLPYTELAAPLR